MKSYFGSLTPGNRNKGFSYFPAADAQANAVIFFLVSGASLCSAQACSWHQKANHGVSNVHVFLTFFSNDFGFTICSLQREPGFIKIINYWKIFYSFIHWWFKLCSFVIHSFNPEYQSRILSSFTRAHWNPRYSGIFAEISAPMSFQKYIQPGGWTG